MNLKRKSRRSHKRNTKSISPNQPTRQNCCWNCYRSGHLRFQCPYQKLISCSFCRQPGVLTSECTCCESRSDSCVSEHRRESGRSLYSITDPTNVRKTEYGSFQENVIVPISTEHNRMKYKTVDNIVVLIQNNVEEKEEEDLDYIEIHAENESLEDIV